MDGDMNEIFSKLTNILNDQEMSANLKNIVENFSASSNEQITQPNEAYQNPNNINPNKQASNNTPRKKISNTNLNNSNHENVNNQNTKNQNTNNQHTKNQYNQSENTQTPEFDIKTILKIKQIMDKINTKKDDPRATLLQSLKPYLNETKKEKIDTYIKFLQMAQIIEFIKPLSDEENQKNQTK